MMIDSSGSCAGAAPEAAGWAMGSERGIGGLADGVVAAGDREPYPEHITALPSCWLSVT